MHTSSTQAELDCWKSLEPTHLFFFRNRKKDVNDYSSGCWNKIMCCKHVAFLNVDTCTNTSDWFARSVMVNYGQWKENIDDYSFSMAIRLDNQVFAERKLSQIDRFKQIHPNVPFKYNQLISFCAVFLHSCTNLLYSATVNFLDFSSFSSF